MNDSAHKYNCKGGGGHFRVTVLANLLRGLTLRWSSCLANYEWNYSFQNKLMIGKHFNTCNRFDMSRINKQMAGLYANVVLLRTNTTPDTFDVPNVTNLGMVRRSPVPLVSSCRENHTSNSFSVPSKKCAPLSSIMRQQTPNKNIKRRL